MLNHHADSQVRGSHQSTCAMAAPYRAMVSMSLSVAGRMTRPGRQGVAIISSCRGLNCGAEWVREKCLDGSSNQAKNVHDINCSIYLRI